MGKTIGRRWNELSEQHKEYYQKLADEDADRYKMEMRKYKTKQEELLENHKRNAIEMQQYAQMAAHHDPFPSM